MNSIERTEQYFDFLSSEYDQATSAPNAWTPPKHVSNALKKYLVTGDTVLIVGVGTGQDIPADLSTELPRQLEGIDLSKKMLEVCQSKFPAVRLHHGDFVSYEGFLRPAYDIIICSGTIEFMPDFSQAM